LGGCLGSIARYKLGGVVLHHSLEWRFPLSTFTVNVLGCLLVGALAGANERFEFLTADSRVFLFSGLLGGFTTFSAFGLETALLLRKGEVAVGLTYALLSVAGGIFAFWIGFLGLRPR
jgi:CrcB protein